MPTGRTLKVVNNSSEMQISLLKEELATVQALLDESLRANAELVPAAREFKKLQSSRGFQLAFFPIRVARRLLRR
jgi:hypothetical protein